MRGDLGGCQGPGSRCQGVHAEGGLGTMVASMREDLVGCQVPGAGGQGVHP